MAAGGRAHARLDVLTGTTVLTIGTASFGPGGSLLTVTTPAGAPVPLLSASDPDGTSNGTLVDVSAPNAPAVIVTLNAGVSWQIDLDGGATRTDVDLAAVSCPASPSTRAPASLPSRCRGRRITCRCR